MRSAKAEPWDTDTPGMVRARVFATWSKVLWSSLRTITRQGPPSPLSGPAARGRSMVCGIRSSCSGKAPGRLPSGLGGRSGMPRSATALGLAALGTFVDRAPVGLAFFDSDLRFAHVNEALAAMNGLSVEAHLGQRPG